MYQTGELVVYGVHGVCRVVDREDRMINKKPMVYLVLEPVGQDGATYFVPMHNAAAMSKIKTIVSKEELSDLLNSGKNESKSWIQDENLRKQTYRELISSGDRAGLIRMVRNLYLHKAVQSALGRKVHLCDENFLHDAEKLLIGEIAVVLDMDKEAAKVYLRNKLKEDA